MAGNHDHSNGCCSSSKSIKLDVKLGELVATLPRPKPKPRTNPVPLGETKLAYYVGVDVGSTTVKSVVVDAVTHQMVWSDYQRHETKQPEKVLEFLNRMQAESGIAPNNSVHRTMGARHSGNSRTGCERLPDHDPRGGRRFVAGSRLRRQHDRSFDRR